MVILEKILWLEACPSNKDPRRMAAYFVDYFKTIRGVPRMIRTDAGTENVVIHALQIALRMNHTDDMSGFRSVSIGRSTSNQRIEMMWSFMRRNLSQFWRNFFLQLVADNLLSNTDELQLESMRFCFLPLIQNHLNVFKDTWNNHRMQANRRNGVLTGIPNNLYNMPLLYGTVDYKYPLSCSIEDLDEIQEDETDQMPFLGCTNEFRGLMQQIAGINGHDLGVISTPNEARELYELLIGLINLYDN